MVADLPGQARKGGSNSKVLPFYFFLRYFKIGISWWRVGSILTITSQSCPLFTLDGTRMLACIFLIVGTPHHVEELVIVGMVLGTIHQLCSKVATLDCRRHCHSFSVVCLESHLFLHSQNINLTRIKASKPLWRDGKTSRSKGCIAEIVEWRYAEFLS